MLSTIRKLIKTVVDLWADENRKWAAQRAEEDRKRERARLDELVEKRKEEAVQLDVSGILIRIREDGRGFEPWLTQYQLLSGKSDETVISFSANSKPYTLSFQDGDIRYSARSRSKDSDEIPSTVTLHDGNGQLLYQARIHRIIYYSGIGGTWYGTSNSRWDVSAFVPGDWVKDLASVIHKADKRKEDQAFKEKHSSETLNDMRKKFGL